MRIYLASPHTFLNFRGGRELAETALTEHQMFIYLAGGESRHWVHDAISRIDQNENISCGRCTVEGGVRSDL